MLAKIRTEATGQIRAKANPVSARPCSEVNASLDTRSLSFSCPITIPERFLQGFSRATRVL
jgi:hypothetical protein